MSKHAVPKDPSENRPANRGTLALGATDTVPERDRDGVVITVTTMRQRVLVLYLTHSALDSGVIAWAEYDGTNRTQHMAGDAESPPYRTGLDALRDGWRLFQASQLLPHGRGEEFDVSYLKYEFFFEKLENAEVSR